MGIFDSLGADRAAREIEARGTGFQMRPNLKPTPGSQGTLFQGGKPTAQHRWVRGYSPSRMAEVATAVDTHIARDRIGEGLPGMPHPHPMFNPASDAHTRRLILEPLARSTHSRELLSQLNGITLHTGKDEAHPTKLAHYDARERSIHLFPITGPDLPEDPRLGQARADATLLHEVGHHEDITSRGGYHAVARQKATNTTVGKLETAADSLMMQRFRNDPRNQRATGHRIGGETYGQRGARTPHGYRDPGAVTMSSEEMLAENHRNRAAQHHKATGEVMLSPGQFQGALF